jgi:hypothetical protein
MTFAPFWTKCLAIANPTPFAAPVTMAVFPTIEKDIRPPFYSNNITFLKYY